MNTIKQITILSLFWLAVPQLGIAQNCDNIIKNEIDEFTGEKVVVSKTKITSGGRYKEAFVQIDRISDSLSLTFIYHNSNMAISDAGVYTCVKGDKMYFLFEDKSVLKLELDGEYYTPRTESAGATTRVLLGRYSNLAKSNKIIFEPAYLFTMDDLDLLASKKATKIRVETRGNAGDTGKKVGNIELVLGDEESSQLMTDAKCISQ
jgi:hypothetical protein